MKASYHKYILDFKQPSGTSRGILRQKETWFLILEKEGKKGIGECGILRGLSCDDRPDYEKALAWVVENIQLGEEKLYEKLTEFPSIQIGVEMAFRSLQAEDPFVLYPSAFTQQQKEIPINGLIWMGQEDFMLTQIEEKLAQGFDCIKMKVGAIDFEKECHLLAQIRKRFTADEIVLRVDANGAFGDDAMEKLNRLAHYDLHSIEQPIAVGQWKQMQQLCAQSPIDIALDEELIGVFSLEEKKRLLENLQPQYIILKPSFVGGFRGTGEWKVLADSQGIGSWVTSALESNVGLNAIAQWTATQDFNGPQGLGTGSLYINNFSGPLTVKNGYLGYDATQAWQFHL